LVEEKLVLAGWNVLGSVFYGIMEHSNKHHFLNVLLVRVV